jgi:hypothetical protein
LPSRFKPVSLAATGTKLQSKVAAPVIRSVLRE